MSVQRAGALWLLLAFLACGLVLARGLPGGFLLDDAPNLQGLELVKGHPWFAARYVFDGPTGFPGRPLSYLSFLLQSGSWPADPGAFKVVNILLHLACGALLYLVLLQATRLARWRDGDFLAAVAAVVWLVHPIQVSTVLYVVQRMTELETLLSLAALAAYLKGRSLAAGGRERAGYAWMSAAIAFGTPLAVLAKENGALVPFYAAVLEITLLSGVPRPRRWRPWAAVFLGVPIAALAAYVAALVWNPEAAYAARSFGLADRLYTEAVVLWDYLEKIVLPRPRAFGVFFDDYPVARAPWESLRTAFALAAWTACTATAVLWRRKFPAFSFAVLWFLAGHLLESTVLPLELYFEHRNYLPLAGPAFALVHAGRRLWQDASSAGARRTFAAIGAAALLIVAAVTWIEAGAWSDPIAQVGFWARERPTSLRAQYALTSLYVLSGHYAQARRELERAQALMPAEASFSVAEVTLACRDPEGALPDLGRVAARISRSPMRPILDQQLEALVSAIEEGRCPRVAPAHAQALADALLANPRLSPRSRWSAW